MTSFIQTVGLLREGKVLR